MDSTRRHAAFRLHGDEAVLNDASRLLDAIYDECVAGGATVLQSHIHRFEPTGVTAFLLLAESHCSLHTWPEERAAELDVFTCGPDIDPEKIGYSIAQRLGLSVATAVRVDTRAA